jgi:hypothetical protein
MAGDPDPLITHDLTIYAVHTGRGVYATVNVGYTEYPSDPVRERAMRGTRELFTNAFHVAPDEVRFDIRKLPTPVRASEHDTTPMALEPPEDA